MKTISQVILPIIFLAGLVFGITYITNYSPPSPIKRGDNTTTAQKPLKFTVLIGQRDTSPKQELTQLRYWRDNYELGEKGHFDFWFENVNNQPVRTTFTTANCQCAGIELSLVSPEAWLEFVNASMVACCPTVSLPSSLAAFNAAQVRLDSTLQWKPMAKNEDASIPAGPQMGIFRLNWTGKDTEGPKSVKATIVAQLPGANAEPFEFEAKFKVVPPFDVYSPSTRGRGIQLGDLRPNYPITREFFVLSRTRTELPIFLSADSLGENKDCVSWSAPVRLSDNEMAKEIAGNSESLDLQCAYRVRLTVSERKEIQQVTKRLDIGPIDFPINVSIGEGKAISVPVTGMVRGDVRVVGNSSDKIDFGATFRSSAAISIPVILESDHSDIELAANESTPAYLQVTLKPEPDRNGAKSWMLTVTIPAGKLFGNLTDSFVVLKTKDAPVRRIRIPVKASSIDSGPRL